MSDTLQPPAHLDNIPPADTAEQPTVKRQTFAAPSRPDLGWAIPDRPPAYLQDHNQATPELNKAVADVLAEMDWVQKRGRNNYFNYDYATADDIREHVARLLGKHGLSYVQYEDEIQPVGSLLMVTYWFQTVHQSGQMGALERVTVFSNAVSERGKADDKALSKARVLALKDWAKNRFSIPTGEDPSNDPDYNGAASGDQQPEQPRGQQSSQPQGGKLDKVAQAAGGASDKRTQAPPPEHLAKARDIKDRIVANVDELPDAPAVVEFLCKREVEERIGTLRRSFDGVIYRELLGALVSPDRIEKTIRLLAPRNPVLHTDLSKELSRQAEAKRAADQSGAGAR